MGCSLSSKSLPGALVRLVTKTEKIPLYYVLNLVVTRQVEGARRGARVKALAICSPKPWVHIFKPLLLLAMDQFFVNPSLDVVESIYHAINNTLFDIQDLPYTHKKCIRSILRNKMAHYDAEYERNSKLLRYYDFDGYYILIRKAIGYFQRTS